jgi:putative membrane protein
MGAPPIDDVTASTARRAPRSAGRGLVAAVPAVLAGAGIVAQVCYPLVDGDALRAVTVGAVLLLSAAAVTHAAIHLGPAAAGLLLAASAGIGLLAEVIGVRTGVPFGAYTYGHGLGPKLLDVPVVVPLAWTMLAYPAVLAARALAGRARRPWLPVTLLVGLIGGWTLAAWDLYLDPQMVAAGRWAWQDPTPGLPGVPGVPLTDYAGWLAVGVLIVAVLHRLLPAPDPRPPDGVPAAVLAWTWVGGALGNLALFGRPAVAAYGAVAMGVTVLPYLVLVVRERRGRR